MLPKLISIGSFYIPTYGVLVALGFLAGLGITLRLARRAGMPAETISNLAVYCAIAGLVGAKLFMFLFDIGYYLRDPGRIFTLETLQAAGVFHGGFIAAFLMALFYMRRQQLPAMKRLWTSSLPESRSGKRSAGWAASRPAAAGAGSAICPGACASVPILPLQCRWTRHCIRCRSMNPPPTC